MSRYRQLARAVESPRIHGTLASVTKCLIARVVVAVALVQLGAEAEANDVQFNDLRSGIVHIGEVVDTQPAPRWLGTGFLVDQRCVFATAKHVVAAASQRSQLVIRFQLPQDRARVLTLKPEVIFEDRQFDLALLRIRSINGQPCRSGPLHVFPLRPALPESSLIGSPVLIVGHPVLTAERSESIDIPVLRKGTIASVEIRRNDLPALFLDMTGVPGFSGSPVVLERTGEALGLIDASGIQGFGFSWGTPLTSDTLRKAVEADESSQRSFPTPKS